MQKKYAIIDVETTGGRASRDKITEIAIVLHDGEKVLDTFESLVNPECPIPYGITEMTGITQEMVENAPKFYEIAKKIVELTEGAIFVAHNVRFDYGFVREEFKRLGYTYTRKQLCTVRLAKKAFPGLPSYGLDSLIRHLGLKVGTRHRAMGDTLATVDLFERILQKEKMQDQVESIINLGIRESKLPGSLTMEKIHAIPEACGVYYFHDQTGQVIYVGKSINIQKRVAQHFTEKTEKSNKLQRLVHDVSWEITGSELVSLLLESHEIKRLRPAINSAQKHREYPYAIFHYRNQAGFICFDVGTVRSLRSRSVDILGKYPSLLQARGWLKSLQSQYQLCQKMCNLEKTTGPCFDYHLRKCLGACIGEEAAELYNERALMAIEQWERSFPHEHFLIHEKGRTAGESAIIKIENGKYAGWSFFDDDFLTGATISEIAENVKCYEENEGDRRIIFQYLRKKKPIRIIPFQFARGCGTGE